MKIYQAYVLSTLLYGSESWTLYASQERRLNVFHFRYLRRILGIKWQDHIPNKDVLKKEGWWPSTLFYHNDGWDGLVMSVVWQTAAFQKTSCRES